MKEWPPSNMSIADIDALSEAQKLYLLKMKPTPGIFVNDKKLGTSTWLFLIYMHHHEKEFCAKYRITDPDKKKRCQTCSGFGQHQNWCPDRNINLGETR